MVNNGYKSISCLEAKVTSLEAQIVDLQKTTKNNKKPLISLCNKADKLKKICESLVKRVAKLESKA